MPNDKPRRFTDKQDREAQHIKVGYLKRGMSAQEAERIGYATVQSQKKKVSIGDLKRGGKGGHH